MATVANNLAYDALKAGFKSDTDGAELYTFQKVRSVCTKALKNANIEDKDAISAACSAAWVSLKEDSPELIAKKPKKEAVKADKADKADKATEPDAAEKPAKLKKSDAVNAKVKEAEIAQKAEAILEKRNKAKEDEKAALDELIDETDIDSISKDVFDKLASNKPTNYQKCTSATKTILTNDHKIEHSGLRKHLYSIVWKMVSDSLPPKEKKAVKAVKAKNVTKTDSETDKSDKSETSNNAADEASDASDASDAEETSK